MYDLKHFIDKFSDIPEDKWGKGSFENMCAYGHCGVREDLEQGRVIGTEEALALNSIFSVLEIPHGGCWITTMGKIDSRVTAVNDRRDSFFPQDTPKQRILAALNKIQDMRDCAEADEAVKSVKEFIETIPFEEIIEEDEEATIGVPASATYDSPIYGLYYRTGIHIKTLK